MGRWCETGIWFEIENNKVIVSMDEINCSGGVEGIVKRVYRVQIERLFKMGSWREFCRLKRMGLGSEISRLAKLLDNQNNEVAYKGNDEKGLELSGSWEQVSRHFSALGFKN